MWELVPLPQGPQADLNLGIEAVADGGATTTPDQIQIDTTQPATHTIEYVATDQSGHLKHPPNQTGNHGPTRPPASRRLSSIRDPLTTAPASKIHRLPVQFP
jgi:hypothetical protein